MIKYNLKCVNKHEFESWFSESKEFDRLKKKKLIECIFCHTKNVEKSIMSPRILNSRDLKDHNKIPNIKMKNFKKDLQNLRKFVQKVKPMNIISEGYCSGYVTNVFYSIIGRCACAIHFIYCK